MGKGRKTKKGARLALGIVLPYGTESGQAGRFVQISHTRKSEEENCNVKKILYRFTISFVA